MAALGAAVAKAGLDLARGVRSAAASRSQGRTEEPSRPPAWALASVALVLTLSLVFATAMRPVSPLSDAVEAYRGDVMRACSDMGVDPVWTDLLLAMMMQESGGDEGVSSAVGARGDVMQAAEGAYGWIVLEGWPARGLEAGTPLASIYAGVLEFKGNLELWEGRLGPIDPFDLEKIGLVVQGYNFGARGWFEWCGEKGVTAYSVQAAEEYSETRMPSGAKGTPAHAQRVLSHYYSPVLLLAGGTVGEYVSAALAIASDDSIGYSQARRYRNPDVDCSSLVWFALRDAGFSTSLIGAAPFTTYTMHDRLTAAGFERIRFEDARGALMSGDILLRRDHTEIVYEPSSLSTIGAHSDYDGASGDSSGNEVDVSPGNAGSGWEWVYRYVG